MKSIDIGSESDSGDQSMALYRVSAGERGVDLKPFQLWGDFVVRIQEQAQPRSLGLSERLE